VDRKEKDKNSWRRGGMKRTERYSLVFSLKKMYDQFSGSKYIPTRYPIVLDDLPEYKVTPPLEIFVSVPLR
jgi:hypothetical protein